MDGVIGQQPGASSEDTQTHMRTQIFIIKMIAPGGPPPACVCGAGHQEAHVQEHCEMPGTC